jgi:putative redox protein
MKTISIQIPASSGISLAARLDLPDDTYRATVLFAHCFTCGKDILAASRIARGLVAQGFAVLRFDFAGIGASEGEFADTNFSSNIQDVADAADWLRAHYQAPELIIGHSLGGTAVIAASPRLPEAKGYVTIGSPSDPRHMLELIGASSLKVIEREGAADVNLEGRIFHIRKQFLNDVQEQQVLHQVRQLHKPLLIMHAPGDRTVPISHATAFFQAAAHPKSFISLGEADHLVANKVDAEFIAEMIATWSKRYIEKPAVT